MAKKIEVTTSDLAMAREICAALGLLQKAFVSVGMAVRAFILDGEANINEAGFDARVKVLHKALGDKYKSGAVSRNAVAGVLKRMRADAGFVKVAMKRGTQNKTVAKTAKEQKPVTKTIKVLPDWAKDMPSLLIAWCEENPIAAIEALETAYKRDMDYTARKAA